MDSVRSDETRRAQDPHRRAASASARRRWSARSARSGRCRPRRCSPTAASASTTSPAWRPRPPPRSRWTSAASPSATTWWSTCSARPGQDRFWFMWDELAYGALGAVVLADTRRLADCFPSIDYFEQRGTPFVVAVNCFDGADRHERGRRADRARPGRGRAGGALRRTAPRLGQERAGHARGALAEGADGQPELSGSVARDPSSRDYRSAMLSSRTHGPLPDT